MNGRTCLSQLSNKLAEEFECNLSEEILNDTTEFTLELLNDGFIDIDDGPTPSSIESETYSWINDAPGMYDLSLTGRCNLGCSYCFYADEMADLLRKEKITAVAVIPMKHRGEIIGSLNFASHTVDRIPQDVRDFLESVALQVVTHIAPIRIVADLT